MTVSGNHNTVATTEKYINELTFCILMTGEEVTQTEELGKQASICDSCGWAYVLPYCPEGVKSTCNSFKPREVA